MFKDEINLLDIKINIPNIKLNLKYLINKVDIIIDMPIK